MRTLLAAFVFLAGCSKTPEGTAGYLIQKCPAESICLVEVSDVDGMVIWARNKTVDLAQYTPIFIFQSGGKNTPIEITFTSAHHDAMREATDALARQLAGAPRRQGEK